MARAEKIRGTARQLLGFETIGVEEAAEMAGVSKRTLDRAIAAGKGPPVVARLGGHFRRLRPRDVRAWALSRLNPNPQKASHEK